MAKQRMTWGTLIQLWETDAVAVACASAPMSFNAFTVTLMEEDTVAVAVAGMLNRRLLLQLNKRPNANAPQRSSKGNHQSPL